MIELARPQSTCGDADDILRHLGSLLEIGTLSGELLAFCLRRTSHLEYDAGIAEQQMSLALSNESG